MVATQEQTHKVLYGAGGERPAQGGGEWGGRDTVPIGIHIHVPVYMNRNRVLPKWYKKVSSYLSLDCNFI